MNYKDNFSQQAKEYARFRPQVILKSSTNLLLIRLQKKIWPGIVVLEMVR